MLLKINGPKSYFWQWDLGRQLIVEDDACGEVHFCNGSTECALVCEIYHYDGLRLVNVPNILLQSARQLTAYLYLRDSAGCTTRHQQTFQVVARNKPDDYVYTETEVMRWEALEQRVLDLIQEMEEAKAAGEFKGDPGKSAYDVAVDAGYEGTVEEYYEELSSFDEKAKEAKTSEEAAALSAEEAKKSEEIAKQAMDVLLIKGKASGKVAAADDAANMPLLGLTVNDETAVQTVKRFGKNFFHRDYETAATNIGVTVGWDAENQEFVFNGTTTASGDIKIVSPLKLDWIPGEKYAVSVRHAGGTATLASGTAVTTYGWGIFQDNASKFVRGATGNSSFLETYTFAATAFALDANRSYIFYFQCWRPGTVFDNYRVKIQIEQGNSLTEWEAYREETVPIDAAQSLMLQKGCNNIVAVPSADITAEYVVDLQLYVDKKIEALMLNQ